MKVAVLLNPRSGTARSEADVRAAFEGLGVECEIVPLAGAEGEDELFVDAARRCDVFVAAGGDGTVNTAATALLGAGGDAALGLLPMGTANDLSRTLGIPGGLADGARVVVHGRSVPIDTIEMADGRIVINQANGGFAGTIAQELEEETKSRWGQFGYWRAGIDVFQNLPAYEVTLVIDGERVRHNALNVTVANGRYSGGGVPVAPDAEYADGKMDVVIIERRMRVGLLPLLPRVLRGTHLDADGIIFRRAGRMEMFSRPDMPFSIDGELREEHPRRFEVCSGRLRIRIPA